MARNLAPKCKQCRRAGEKLFLKGERCQSTKCAMVKRNYPPGIHGSKGRPRMTDYGQQLNEKQKAKKEYNLLEKQFRLTFEKAKKQGGNTGENFIMLLERRLDNVIHRMGFASSRTQARQFVNHGHFIVNDIATDIPSFIVKTGDVIKIKSNKKDNKNFSNLSDKLKKKEIPGWINLDAKKLEAKILHNPTIKDIKTSFNVQMIVEYYSR
ncbi:30S ribosomal protein S4 [Candidatus Parcubacteria bacterium]|nr:30S ribosomal protein S4 [Candidatus Parcubacteria bacterium]